MSHGWSWRDVLHDRGRRSILGLEMTLVASKRSATAVLLCCLLHSSAQYLASLVVAKKSAIAVLLCCHLLESAHVATTAPPTRSRKTAPPSNTPRPSTSSCHCSPLADSRILPFKSKSGIRLERSFAQKGKQDVLVSRRVLHKVLVPLKATSAKFRGRWYQAKKVPHLPSVDCALFSVPSSGFVLIVAFPLVILRPRPRTKRSKYS